jgi:hypothetical protein
LNLFFIIAGLKLILPFDKVDFFFSDCMIGFFPPDYKVKSW